MAHPGPRVHHATMASKFRSLDPEGQSLCASSRLERHHSCGGSVTVTSEGKAAAQAWRESRVMRTEPGGSSSRIKEAVGVVSGAVLGCGTTIDGDLLVLTAEEAQMLQLWNDHAPGSSCHTRKRSV